jgi:hypothetical protein
MILSAAVLSATASGKLAPYSPQTHMLNAASAASAESELKFNRVHETENNCSLTVLHQPSLVCQAELQDFDNPVTPGPVFMQDSFVVLHQPSWRSIPQPPASGHAQRLVRTPLPLRNITMKTCRSTSPASRTKRTTTTQTLYPPPESTAPTAGRPSTALDDKIRSRLMVRMGSYNIPDAVIPCDDAHGPVAPAKLTNALHGHVAEPEASPDISFRTARK